MTTLLTNFKSILLGLGILLLCLTHYKAYSFGVEHEHNRIAEATQAEMIRQQKANDEAQEVSEARIKALQESNDILNEKIEQNNLEAAKDPDAGRICLNASGVRRLNGVNTSEPKTSRLKPHKGL